MTTRASVQGDIGSLETGYISILDTSSIFKIYTDVVVTGDLDVGGSITLTGGVELDGNVDLGDAATDLISIIGTVDTDVIIKVDDVSALAVKTAAGVEVFGVNTVTGEVSVNTKIAGKETLSGAILNEVVSATNPTLVPNKGDVDTGVGWSTDALELIVNSISELKIDETQVVVGSDDLIVTSGTIVAGASVTTAGHAILLNEVASATNPVFAFGDDYDTGIGANGANTIVLVTGGVTGVAVNTIANGVDYLTITPGIAGAPGVVDIGVAGTDTNIRIKLTPKGTGNVVIPDGSATLPSVGFATQVTTGFYYNSDSTIGVTCGGTLRTLLGGTDSGGFIRVLPMTTITAPEFSFTTDTDTGIGRAGVNLLSLIAGNTEITQCSSVGSVDKIASVLKGTTGGISRKFSEAVSAALTGASAKIEVNVPVGVRLLGVQLRVDTAVTTDDVGLNYTWSAAYSGGATQNIVTGAAAAKQTKVNTMFDENAATPIASGEVDITLTPVVGAFTAGVVRAIVYYETFETMGDAV